MGIKNRLLIDKSLLNILGNNTIKSNFHGINNDLNQYYYLIIWLI